MKKILIVVLVLAFLAVTAFPALAAGGPPNGQGNGQQQGNGHGGSGGAANRRAPFAFVGTIVSVDATTRTVVVTVVAGNTVVKSYIGQNLTIQTTDTTRFLLRNPDGTATVIAFENLVPGQNVSVNGKLSNNVWSANRITVGAELDCQQ